jgi:hypothetical protein
LYHVIVKTTITESEATSITGSGNTVWVTVGTLILPTLYYRQLSHLFIIALSKANSSRVSGFPLGVFVFLVSRFRVRLAQLPVESRRNDVVIALRYLSIAGTCGTPENYSSGAHFIQVFRLSLGPPLAQ